MTDVAKLVEQYTEALEDFSQSLARANDTSLSIDERMRRLKETDPFWDRLMAVQQEVDKLG